MYELVKLKGKDKPSIPKVQRFKSHSPITIGASLYLGPREGDGKMLTTSRVTSVSYVGNGVKEITTLNSVYELRKI